MAEGPALKRKREERFAWDAEKLEGPSGIELSFEEVEAQAFVICSDFEMLCFCKCKG